MSGHKLIAFCSDRKTCHLGPPGDLIQLIVERRQGYQHAECLLPDQRTGQEDGVTASQVMFNCQGVAAHHRDLV
jgi:hypothetical protein